MTDLSKTIVAKSDQLNADDLVGISKTIKINGVKLTAGDQPVSISYEGDEGKPWKPCKSMRRVLIRAWGSDGEKYIGKSVTLFNDPAVKWAGSSVGGIRISHMSDLKEELVMPIAITRGKRMPYTVLPLEVKEEKTIQQLREDCKAALESKGIALDESLTENITKASTKAELAALFNEIVNGAK